jgi:hypothetical protein
MMRVVLSIKAGKVMPSTLLRKLGIPQPFEAAINLPPEIFEI